MKATKIYYQKCFNLGNYQNEVVGIELEIGEGEKARCIQYFNKAIKQICKKVGLTELIIYEEEQNDKIVMVRKPKYEMISSHTARRTFATNMIKNNIPSNKIMKCTGHKTSASFDRYDRMTLEDNARSLAGNGYLS